MKARLAKKILLGRDKKRNIYWVKRVFYDVLDYKKDQRVAEALRIYFRKK